MKWTVLFLMLGGCACAPTPDDACRIAAAGPTIILESLTGFLWVLQ